jgi:two-component system OmpR family sensor kinase
VIRRLSLRARLLLGLMVVATVGLVVADVVVYTEVRSYLVRQIDGQLNTALRPLYRAISTGSDFAFGESTPPGTYGALLAGSSSENTNAPLLGPDPALPSNFVAQVTRGDNMATGTLAGATQLTVGAIGEPSFKYAVLAKPINVLNQDTGASSVGVMVVAIPLRSLNATLGDLLDVDLEVSAAVLAALALLGLLVVRIGMRPLGEIEQTAQAIAAGDLSRRVERDDPGTEIGRLGASLNAMLAQIEFAFSEQRASEGRLRRFLSDASHELRTPITSIRGYSELFRRGAASRPEDLGPALRRIEEEAIRMGVLVEEMLLLARLDEGRPLERELVDLTVVAADSAADAQARDPARRVTFIADEPVAVFGDEPRLRQLVANLVQNALVHTPPEAPIEVRVTRDGERAVLAVRDEGPGIAPEHAAHIFDRFYRADPSRTRESGGTGLGLAIVASIAEAHGGTARVETELGKGSTFLVALPVSHAAQPDDAANGGPTTPPTNRRPAAIEGDPESGVSSPVPTSDGSLPDGEGLHI